MSNGKIAPPFEIGQRVLPADLFGWVYTGLAGRPGETGATRRYVKDHCGFYRPHATPMVRPLRRASCRWGTFGLVSWIGEK